MPTNTALGRLKQDDQVFKVILGYIFILKPAWITRNSVTKIITSLKVEKL